MNSIKSEHLLELSNILKAFKKTKNVFANYLFYYIFKSINDNQYQTIQNNFKKSPFITVDYKEIEQNEYFFIISFHKTLIIINNSDLSVLVPLFTNNQNIPIYFLTNFQDQFNQLNIHNQQFECDSQFLNEIDFFFKKMSVLPCKNPSIKKLWKTIQPCIAGYLIKKSYFKLNEKQKNKFLTFKQNEIKTNDQIESINLSTYDDEYIEIKPIGNGSSFQVYLIYNIEKEELFAIKKPMGNNVSELTDREIKNYKSINHPLLPQLYQIVNTTCYKYQIIQFINGTSLKNINKISLTEDDKITIIVELMLIFDYFHKNNFVYRDLRPDNAIIDDNKNIFIIDFDHMKKIEPDDDDTQEHTKGFASNFVAPEVDTGNPTYKGDIYSIGKMIHFIWTENKSVIIENPKIKQIYKICTEEKYEKRPTILELMFVFYYLFYSQINSSIIENNQEMKYFQCLKNFDKELIKQDINKAIHYYKFASKLKIPEAQYNLGSIYLNKKFNLYNINKAIKYFKRSAELNFAESQFTLGSIYSTSSDCPQNINKSIYYYSLAAKQNHLKSLSNLGYIYSEDRYHSIDINKAIHLYKIAADQKDPRAQLNLGVIYSESLYIEHDYTKAIHYFTLAANQDIVEAQTILGNYYLEGKFVAQNIQKAIDYFTRAANLNYVGCMYNLGLIYSNGIYVKPDVNKAIHYYSLAAEQKEPKSIVNLGNIYSDGKLITRDMDKAIKYYMIADDLNIPEAEFNLGNIYMLGKFVKKDINKAIYYFTRAANQNFALAQNNLGVIFYHGIDIERDISKAIYYFTKAANQNVPDSQFILGVIYYAGKYIKPDITKSIHYFSLAANQNYLDAFFNLGFIYRDGKYAPIDINKSIYYYKIAAKFNLVCAQYNLGLIYYDNKYILKDIYQSIYYFTQAALQNHPKAQCALGYIYSQDKSIQFDVQKAIYYLRLAASQNLPQAWFLLAHIYYDKKISKQDINKAIYYFTQAADHNFVLAQFDLGVIYIEGKVVKRNLLKAFHYFTLASKKNYHRAQYNLGILYLMFNPFEKSVVRGIDYLIQSSSNGNIDATYAIAFFYQEGKHIKRDIKKAIHYYQIASSFNNKYAKNNLGIIYKNGIENEIQQNIEFAIIYFDENIKRSNDRIAMYNLAHIYIYIDKSEEMINKSIDLLIKSINQNLLLSELLLCVALIIKHGLNFNNIYQEIKMKTEKTSLLSDEIIEIMNLIGIKSMENFDELYRCISKVDVMYNFLQKPIFTFEVFDEDNKTETINNKIKNITKDFYEGFGI